MNNMDADSHLPGVLLMEGKFEDVCKLCEEQERKGLLNEFEHPNWAIALMNLGSFEAAGAISKRLAEINPELSARHVDYAICAWYLGNWGEALETWNRALSCKYQSLGGGVEVAAMLYYASLKAGDHKFEKKARGKLKKLWSSGEDWPAPIAGCLLNEVAPEALLSLAQNENPALEERHSCQAYFWQGFQLQKSGKVDEAKIAFAKSSNVGGGSVLESERYLAKWELLQV